jgi:hypothetical protein
MTGLATFNHVGTDYRINDTYDWDFSLHVPGFGRYESHNKGPRTCPLLQHPVTSLRLTSSEYLLLKNPERATIQYGREWQRDLSRYLWNAAWVQG